MLNIDTRFFKPYLTKIKANGYLLLSLIADHSNKSGECYPSRRTLGKESGMSLNSVDKYLQILMEEDLIEKINRYKKHKNGEIKRNKDSNLYRLKTDFITVFAKEKGSAKFEQGVAQNLNKGSAKFEQGVAQNLNKGSAKFAHKVLPIEVLPIEVLKKEEAKAFFSTNKKTVKSPPPPKEKKVAPKKRKDDTLEKMKIIFEKKYRQIINDPNYKFQFDQKQSRQLLNLKNKIKKEIGKEVKEEELLEQFEFFLLSVVKNENQWYLQNFTPAILSSKFQEIITFIKLSKNGNTKKGKHNASVSVKRRIGEELFGRSI